MKTQERKRVLPHFLLIGIFLLMAFTLKATNAPVTTAATVCNAVVNQQVTVPITVTGFSNISGFTLTMDYDYAKLHFVKASSTSNSALGGVCDIGEINMGGNNRRVTISWYRNGNPGITLPDGSAIANYVFTYISGPAALTWFDMGPSCVYNDPDVNTLSDTPTSTYYINGLISGSCLNTPTITPDGPTSFCEGNHVNLTASAGTAWKWSTNETAQSINVTLSGSYTVEVTDAGGAKATSAATVVTVTPLPLAPTVDITQTSCSFATGTITVTSPVPATGISYTVTGTNPVVAAATNSTGVFSGLNPGDYDVTTTNASGCTSLVTSKTINPALATPDAPTTSLSQPTCAVATGTITVTSPVPATGISYTVTGTNPVVAAATNSTGVFSGLNPGVYDVTTTNASGCTSLATSKTISAQPLAPIVKITNPSAVISPATVDLTAEAVTTGSTPGLVFTYWTNNAATNEYQTPNNATAGTYYIKGTMPETGCFDIEPVTVLVIPYGSTQLSFRLVNPRIANISAGNDYFEFDVQVKANVAGTYLWEGNVNLDFNNSTLSKNLIDWSADPGPTFIGKYSTAVSLSSSTVNVACSGNPAKIQMPATSTDFTEITDSYQTLVTIRGKISNNNGAAGIHFDETLMNGKQFYKLSDSPWYAGYASPNEYESADFVDTYVGRVYSDDSSLSLKSATTVPQPGWTQVTSLDWTANVNTSVWNGNAQVPGGSLVLTSNLRIHNPATLTVPEDGEMTVSGETDIKTTDGLLFQSTATGTGSFITGTVSGAGSAVVQRYMTTDAWHIVSSPVSGQSIADFLATNSNVATDDASLRGMMDYNPELNQWNDYFTNSTVGDLGGGKGFCLRTNANSAVSFNGHLKAGNQIVSGLSPDLWNCVGNPYTSAIGINNLSSSGSRFLEENAENLDPSYGAIYVWDNGDINNGVWGKYTIISNTPTPDTGFDVQQGQAFMVKMRAGSSTINFNSGMQIHEPALPLKSIKSLWPTIKLEATVAGQKVSTLIAFNGGMTKGLDPTYDAGLLKGSSDLVVYSRLVEDNGLPFAIQALPSNEYESLIIPIGIDSKTGGEVVFSSELMNLPSDCQVILEDKASHTFTDLSKNVYSTILAANSSISDRFQLHTSYLTTGLNMAFFTGQLSAYAIRNIEIKVKGDVTNQAVATLYDVQGRMILIKNLEAGSLNTIRTPNIRTGIYVLIVKDNNKLQGFKIPVRE